MAAIASRMFVENPIKVSPKAPRPLSRPRLDTCLITTCVKRSTYSERSSFLCIEYASERTPQLPIHARRW